MNRAQAETYIGRMVRGSCIDEVRVCGRDPIDHRIYLMSEGERVIEVAGATHEHINQLGKPEARAGHNKLKAKPEVKV